jgi:hypothetical protein
VFIAVAWQQRRGGDARRCETMRGDTRRCATRHGTAELGSARRKHRFVYCCVIVGACFNVIVFACGKYATILYSSILLHNIHTATKKESKHKNNGKKNDSPQAEVLKF